MTARIGRDSVAWIAAVVAALLIRMLPLDFPFPHHRPLPGLHVPTLAGCGLLGIAWVACREIFRRSSQRVGLRWVSVMLTGVAPFAAVIPTLVLLWLWRLEAARSVLAIALGLAGFGWGLASEWWWVVRLRLFRGDGNQKRTA